MANKLQLRREKILDLLSQIPISSTQQLAKATDVSTETMRKDLDALAEGGLIIKVHGGVALANTISEIPFDLRAKEHVEQKIKIAAAAAKLIDKGEAILMENCTTNLELARVLVQDSELLQTLVVITNSVEITSLFNSGGLCQRLFFLGGWVNPQEHAAHGYQTTKMMQEIHANKAFISGAAISEQLMITGYYDDDVAFQKTALQCADEIILMLDSSKYGKNALLTVAHLSDMDYLVTNQAFPKEQLKEFTAMNISYILAQ
ncbi:MAG: DeoR/GlpR family DNA-binding transcription regulator [Hungatella sp.]|jgi:DeoR/GlpR family transcriptional regulator of sugar metabolism|nr:DeoR/GlpR family DNA-binding transcription regulator [Hungatella sp.]